MKEKLINYSTKVHEIASSFWRKITWLPHQRNSSVQNWIHVQNGEKFWGKTKKTSWLLGATIRYSFPSDPHTAMRSIFWRKIPFYDEAIKGFVSYVNRKRSFWFERSDQSSQDLHFDSVMNNFSHTRTIFCFQPIPIIDPTLKGGQNLLLTLHIFELNNLLLHQFINLHTETTFWKSISRARVNGLPWSVTLFLPNFHQTPPLIHSC